MVGIQIVCICVVERTITYAVQVSVCSASCILVEYHVIVGYQRAVSGLLEANRVIVIAAIQSDGVQLIRLHHAAEFLIRVLSLCFSLAEVLHDGVIALVDKVLFEGAILINTCDAGHDIDGERNGEVVPSVLYMLTRFDCIEEVRVSGAGEVSSITYLSRSGRSRCVTCFRADGEVTYFQFAAECQIARQLYLQIANRVIITIDRDGFVNLDVFVVVVCQGDSTAPFSRIDKFLQRSFIQRDVVSNICLAVATLFLYRCRDGRVTRTERSHRSVRSYGSHSRVG